MRTCAGAFWALFGKSASDKRNRLRIWVFRRICRPSMFSPRKMIADGRCLKMTCATVLGRASYSGPSSHMSHVSSRGEPTCGRGASVSALLFDARATSRPPALSEFHYVLRNAWQSLHWRSWRGVGGVRSWLLCDKGFGEVPDVRIRKGMHGLMRGRPDGVRKGSVRQKRHPAALVVVLSRCLGFCAKV